MSNMNFEFDRRKVHKCFAEATVDVECPGCGVINKATMSEIAEESTITCMGCQQPIQLLDENGNVKKFLRG